MHGSLLPRYRGRAPVNWAILHGERETGATLHAMVERADAGDIVDQEAVPIGPEDTIREASARVTEAAARVLARNIEALLQGRAPRRPQDPGLASYFGRRRPEDGRIDWQRGAGEIFNLVRAVHPSLPRRIHRPRRPTAADLVGAGGTCPAGKASRAPARVLTEQPLRIGHGKRLPEVIEWQQGRRPASAERPRPGIRPASVLGAGSTKRHLTMASRS
jgi:methionyl-tRNA formyltransferase